MNKNTNPVKLPIYNLFNFKFEEEPRYYVILREQQKQVRKYRPFVMAETFFEGDQQTSLTFAFKKLYRFIKGKNSTGETLPLIAPVLFRRGLQLFGEGLSDTGWAMGFILSCDKKFLPPAPLTKSIKLEKVPSLFVATIRYTGANNREKINEKTTELLTWAHALKDFHVVSSPRIAQYNTSFILPIFRRNEIQVTLEEIKIIPRSKNRQ